VPVGIAYAEASGVPGVNGLYAAIVPLLAYALFGPSRILILGPDSALAALILTGVLPLSAGVPQRAVALAGMMAIVSGVVCVAAGMARLGFITELLSKPIRYGYMNGIALTVLLSQVPKLFGFSVTAKGPLRQDWGIVNKVLAGSTNVVALAIGAGTLALILLLKRRPRVPAILIAVVAATVVVAAFHLATLAGVSVLGPLPRGIARTTPSPYPRQRLGTYPHGWRRGRPRFIRGHERAHLGPPYLNLRRHSTAVYRGAIDTPKTDQSIRRAALPEGLLREIEAWRSVSIVTQTMPGCFRPNG